MFLLKTGEDWRKRRIPLLCQGGEFAFPPRLTQALCRVEKPTAGDYMVGKFFTLVVFIILCGALAAAQVTTATISGVARDQSGALIPGVSVAVRNRGHGNDEDGDYRRSRTLSGSKPGRRRL